MCFVQPLTRPRLSFVEFLREVILRCYYIFDMLVPNIDIRSLIKAKGYLYEFGLLRVAGRKGLICIPVISV